MGKAPAKGRPGNLSSELRDALKDCRTAFCGVAVLSGLVNLLFLTGAIYMLEVYDRVLPSRSIPTLLGLSVLALVLFGFQGVLDIIRSRILVRIGASVDERISGRVYDIVVQLPLRARSQTDGLAALRDLDHVRAFLSSTGPTALFDFPWMPVYLFICYLFHPVIGLTALAGAILLVMLTALTEIFSREPAKTAVQHAAMRNSLAEAGRRNAEALRAMGMAGRTAEVWRGVNAKYMASQQRASDVAGGLGALSRVLRFALQSGVLGIGAYLVIQQQASGGVIIASAVLVSRALAPVELAIANWKAFIAAREGWKRLSDLLGLFAQDEKPMQLPAPQVALVVENAAVAPPGTQKIVVQDVSFTLKAGQGLGVIGPSASGKSSLARLIVGVWAPARGNVRLDGAALSQWAADELGQHIGYLPQDVELVAGTVAQNIARFEPEPPADVVIAAAQAAGVHDMIVRLSEGYDTQIGEGGAVLSAGQRQRVALARALYRDPFLVVLDEPNSNLDAEGDRALTAAMMKVRARGGIVVVVAHRRSALASVDQVLAMAQGRLQMVGPKDEVLSKLFSRQQPAATAPPGVASAASAPLRLVGDLQGTSS